MFLLNVLVFTSKNIARIINIRIECLKTFVDGKLYVNFMKHFTILLKQLKHLQHFLSREEKVY